MARTVTKSTLTMIRPTAQRPTDAPRTGVELPPVNRRGFRHPVAPAADALVHAARLAALGELTPGVAHELGNPLLGILGLVELALGEVAEGSPAKRRLELARDTALEMRGVLRTLVDFAREPVDAHGPVNLGEAVRDTVDLAHRTSSATDVELYADIGTEPVYVVGNRGRLRHCVLELLFTARGAIPEGGRIAVEVKGGGGWASVRVSDSGPGLSAEAAARAFEPFFRAGPGGSGLGLAAGRAIAAEHGGSLGLESGAFVLRLPLASEDGSQ
jgi:signal transduction histidine kinase